MILVGRVEFFPVAVQAADTQTAHGAFFYLWDDDAARQPEAPWLPVIPQDVGQPPADPGTYDAVAPLFAGIVSQPVPRGRGRIDAAGRQPGQMFRAALQTVRRPERKFLGMCAPLFPVHGISRLPVPHRFKTSAGVLPRQFRRPDDGSRRSDADPLAGVRIGHAGIVPQELDAVPLRPTLPAPVVAAAFALSGPEAAPFAAATDRAG